MLNKNIKSKKGFTIIEVVLVLAIAGLIMLMVFVALPALQRSQRDTQRKSDLDKLQSQLVSYVSSNNRLPVISSTAGGVPGALPTVSMAYTTSIDLESDAVTGVGNASSTDSRNGSKSFGQFIRNYLLVDGDTFEDPSGEPYHIVVLDPTSDVESYFGDELSDDIRAINTDEYSDPDGIFIALGDIDDDDDDIDGESDLGLSKFNRIIYVVYDASCYDDESTPIVHLKSDGKKTFALAMRLEGGSVYCLDN